MANNEEKEKKKPDLEKLADDLDPDKVNEKTAMPHLKAHHAYKLEKISVVSYDDFREQITKYMKHHHKEVYKTDMPDEIAFERARQILEQMFEKEGGFIGAYKKARQGRLGEIIKALADSEEQQHRVSYVRHIFQQIDPLDWDSHVDLVKQYKSKYGSLLPESLKQKSDEELAKDYQALIDHHVGVVDKAKERLKKYEPKKEEEERREAA